MLKAFLGVMIMGRPGEPEFVSAELTNNPASELLTCAADPLESIDFQLGDRGLSGE